MLLSPSQQNWFWRNWNTLIVQNHWDRAEAEAQRKALLARIGFTSLTQVGSGDGFTELKKEIGILQNNLNTILHAEDNPRRVLLFTIRAYGFNETYIKQLCGGDDGASGRFHTWDYESLPMEQLEALRNTLADRAVQQHKTVTTIRRAQRRRRQQKHLSGYAGHGVQASACPRERDHHTEDADPY